MQKNQVYHLEPPYGLVNDPNAFLVFEGTYYLFFQWNPIAKDHSHKDWGYFTSRDLIHWDFCGQAIKAGAFYDRDGIYSGTGLVYDDQIYLYYTGNVRLAGQRKSFQNLATSADGQTFVKEGMLFVTPRGFTEHMRDPKVFMYNNTFYMLLAAQEDKGTGAIILYTSPNPHNFNFLKILATTDKYEMVECPDIAFFGDRALLNFALQKRDNELDKDLYARSFYKVVTFDFKTNQISNPNLDVNEGLMDYGFDFYVPQTLKLDDGRVIMIAWMSNMTKDEALIYGSNSYSIHCLTMIREVALDGNHLIQKPIKEYENILGKSVEPEDNQVKFDRRQWRLKLKFSETADFNLKLNDEAEISYLTDSKELLVSRISWVTGKKESRSLSLDQLDALEIWSDTSSLEIYINEGYYTSSLRLEPKSSDCVLTVESSALTDLEANEIDF